MTKNYLFVLLFLFSGFFFGMLSQEPRIFKVEDFDLQGNVKSCLVVTNYGKEEYDFDAEGRLTKSVTRFSDTDYDVTRYKFEKEELIERRMENYRDGKFEPSTSFGSFYEIEQLEPRIVIEKIFSYDKEFLDSYRYTYDSQDKLIKIVHSGNEGEDETEIEYSGKGENVEQTFSINGVVQKTVKVSYGADGKSRTELNVQYLDGIRTAAIEKVFNAELKLVSETKSNFDKKTKKFVPQEIKNYFYDEKGMLNKLVTKEGDVERVQEYIYQYDNEETGNWVKEIITPDNLYTTRRIKYYPTEEVVKQGG